MMRTQVYLTDDLYYRIQLEAKRGKKKAAEVVRDLLRIGLDQNKTNAGDALLEMTKMKLRGPKYLSSNIDTYLYGE